MMKHPAWGIDLTSAALRAAKLELTGEGNPRLLAWDLVDFTEEVDDLESLQRFATVGRAAFHFRSRHKLQSSHVWASVRAESAFVRTVTVPPVNDESLERILELEAQQQIPHPLEEVFWDRRVLAIKDNGEVLATLLAVKRAVVDDRLRKMGKAGIPVDAVQLRPIALQNFCAYERLLERGTIVVDVDYSGVQVLIHHDDQTWFRVLPVGGVDLIEGIKEEFGIPHRTAVRMAIGQEVIPNKERFLKCRAEAANDVVDEVVRTVKYYFAARPGLKSSGVVLFQSHPSAPPIRSLLKERLDLPVFVPKGFRHIEVHPDVVSAGIQENFGALSKAVGLALQGIGRAEVDVKLFPAELTRTLGTSKWPYAIAAACLLGGVAWAGYQHRSLRDDLVSTQENLHQVVASGRKRADVEKQMGVNEPIERMQGLGEVGQGRTGPLPWLEDLYARVHATHGGVQLVGLDYDTEEGAPRAAITLAVSMKPGEDPRTVLGDFLETLRDLGHVRAVRPKGDSWIGGAPTVRRGESPAEGQLLRCRLYHQAYILDLEEGA